MSFDKEKRTEIVADSLEFHTVCPFCQKALDRASNSHPEDDAKTPRDGDFSMCVECGEIAVFDSTEKTNIRKPTETEYTEIGLSPYVRRARDAWVTVSERNKAKNE